VMFWIHQREQHTLQPGRTCEKGRNCRHPQLPPGLLGFPCAVCR
jgi:hypothetical protein